MPPHATESVAVVHDGIIENFQDLRDEIEATGSPRKPTPRWWPIFYEFNLEDRVPTNHLLRRIDAVLDLSWLRAELAPCL